MIRLHAIVEGYTEEQFIKNFLANHLAQFQICTDVCCVTTSRNRRRDDVIHRGGMVTYEHLKNDITRRIASDNHRECRYTTMIDFYQLPHNFPGYDQFRSNMGKYEQIQILEDALAEDIGDERFIPYIQLHEFETLLFVNPELLGEEYFKREREIQALVKMTKVQPNPELINNSVETAPSKRIKNLIPEYHKLTGASIVSKIGLNCLRERCRHFREWFEKLEALQ